MVTTATDFGAALTAAFQGQYVAQLTGQTYTITSPIVIHVTGTVTGPVGIDGGGATLISQVTNGAPLIQIIADPGVNIRYLTLSNFTIAGNGHEGDGIQIVADGNDRGVYDWSIGNVNVQHVGGYGIDVRGSVFEGMVSNSWMSGNALGGAYFAHSPGGGIASALRWFGGGFQDNGGAGLTLDNGTRDMAVDHASFVNNHGPGISALWGITAVTASDFVNNQGVGATFQNYGNFDDNTFSTSGSQTVGMSAYLVNTATLVNNTSTYTGAGSDPTVLANMRGPGGLFVAGDSGPIVTEPSVQTGAILANVLAGTQGVAVPTLSPVTAATTAPMASSTGTGALETALKTAMASGTVVHLTGVTYTVTKSIVINVTASTQGPVGIDLGGAKILSQITDGSPVIEIIAGPGVNLGGLTLSNFMLEGNGQEGDGIKIVADGNDRSVHDWNFSNLELEHVGGIGLDVLGNVFQGTVFDSWMNANTQGGARFANSAHGGAAGGLAWTGGGFRANGVAGLILDNGTHDMTVKGAYFVSNDGPGVDATSGITLVQGSGFENNQGTGAIVQGSANFSDDTFSTYGPQMTGIGGYLAGGQVTVIGDLAEYYGPGSAALQLANVQGQGTLAVAGNGTVVVGPQVAVTGGAGAPPTVIEAQGSTSLVQVGNHYFLFPVGGSSGPELSYNGAPFVAGQTGAWVPTGAEKTAGGYEVAWKVTGADQYAVWSTDSSGNYQSTTGVVSGSSAALQVAESSFHQDLNGDGTIGLHTTVIEAQGSTSLVQVANNYFLYPVGGSSGPELSFLGAPFVAGQTGAWVPIGAEKTASGYEVAWKVTGADQYAVWTTDGSGNYQSTTGVVSGSSSTLQFAESSFHQDLNGDGTIGALTTVIEASGSTSLVEVGNNYFLYPVGGSSGPELSFLGAPFVAGQTGAWVPIGAEKTAGGYEVAWKVTGADQYAVWSTDSSGNYQSTTGVVSGSSAALQSLEPSFHQDLNGDGTIGALALLTDYLASTFVTPAGESTGSVVAAQSSAQDFLTKPIV
jgi:20S proteasome alpha/beta subunit